MAKGWNDVRLGWRAERPTCRTEAEIRVLRALATERCKGIVKAFNQGAQVAWPAYDPFEGDRAAAEKAAEPYDDVDIFIPTLRDRSDWDAALCWFGAINPPTLWRAKRKLWSYNREQKVVRWRSFGLQSSAGQPSWPWIAQEMRMTEYGVRAEYEHAIDGIWRAARGLSQRQTRDQAARERVSA